jgi:dienelactone hydrolase
LLVALSASAIGAADQDPTRILESGKHPQDARLGPYKTLNGYFPFQPPASRAAWESRKRQVRQQVLVANGLWPMPEKIPLYPVIHGKIDREGYTIEKVYFASLPGHYVCGNLYRPKGKSGKLPAVLCPHGHWANGRFFDAGEKAAQAQIQQGAEKTLAGARYPLQARCANLALMGCVVFHYDMVGYADSKKQFEHRTGFTDVQAELQLQSFMGLQTFNSIRALDFLLSLPEVDRKRVGVTGASGGGTQTFILCAIDDRPAAAFPAVMVSTAMQGGCICENCSYLRQGTGNVEIAALFAPKPLGMTGADDWTIDIETKGLPELKALYKLYGAEEKVMAKCFKQFKHNYNQVSREVMYNWLNKHLKLGQKEPVVEKPFVPVPPEQLTVFDKEHPLPKDAAGPEKLRQYLTQLSALRPWHAKSLEQFHHVVGTALEAMVHDKLPRPDEVSLTPVGDVDIRDGIGWAKYFLGRKGRKEQVPALRVKAKRFNGTVVVWVHSAGKSSLVAGGKLVPAARRILDHGADILAVDVLRTGELQGGKAPAVDAKFAGYTFGYNRPLLAERVHDILSAVACAQGLKGTKAVHLVGFEQAGPWLVLARALCGDAVTRTAADLNGFRFDKVTSTADEMMLPGALKYGGLPVLASLSAPGEMLLHNTRGTGVGPTVKRVYDAAGKPDRAQCRPDKMEAEKVSEWLLR